MRYSEPIASGNLEGSYGVLGKYVYLRDPVPRLPDFPENIAGLLDAGKAYGAMFTSRQYGRPSFSMGHKLLREQMRRNTFVLKDSNPWHRFYKAVFWFSAMMELPERREKGLIGAISQANLTEALLGISEADRRSTYADLDPGGNAKREEWRRQYSGAMSVARVAACLHDLGVSIVLPTMDVDTIYKIDLFGQRPAGRGVPLSLQIKSIDRRGTSWAERMDADRPRPQDLNPDSRRSLEYAQSRKAMHMFLEEQRFACVPAMVYVAHHLHGRVWEFDTSSTLYRAISSLLD